MGARDYRWMDLGDLNREIWVYLYTVITALASAIVQE